MNINVKLQHYPEIIMKLSTYLHLYYPGYITQFEINSKIKNMLFPFYVGGKLLPIASLNLFTFVNWKTFSHSQPAYNNKFHSHIENRPSCPVNRYQRRKKKINKLCIHIYTLSRSSEPHYIQYVWIKPYFKWNCCGFIVRGCFHIS